MKIIGLYIYPETPSNISKRLEPGWYPFVESEFDIDNPQNPPVINGGPEKFFYTSNEKLNINISVIVGKNGSGKSTLSEIVLNLINNLCFHILKEGDIEDILKLSLVKNIYAELFYEKDDNIYSIKNDDTTTTLSIFTSSGRQELDLKNKYVLSEHLFYTLSLNYGLYSFNQSNICGFVNKVKGSDYEYWFDRFFHRIDGYRLPLTIIPDRYKGCIDVNRENTLANQRLCAISLYLKIKGKKRLIKEYEPVAIRYAYQGFSREEAMAKTHAVIQIGDNPDTIEELFDSIHSEWSNKLSSTIHRNLDMDLIESSLNYITYKTLKICVMYPFYRKYITEREDNSFSELIDNLLEDKSHITLKIRCVINFLKDDFYIHTPVSRVTVEDIINKYDPKDFNDLQGILPPPFFYYEMEYISKRIQNSINKQNYLTIYSLSSGERQQLYYISSVLTHLANLSSIPVKDLNRVAYHHINIIMDEVELYFHPEYQRTFIYRLIEALSTGIIDSRRIRSVNIICVTHSPFILSDIPEGNVLYLGEKSKDKNNTMKTFGANIYDLLKDGFFMEVGMGEFSLNKIKEIFKVSEIVDIEEKRSLYHEKKRN